MSQQPAISPIEKLFGAVELLEHILSFLPMKDLLLAQRVSTTFKGTIDESITLQQALYFSPIAPTHNGRFIPAVANPLLSQSPLSILAIFDHDRIPRSLSLTEVEHTPASNPFWFEFHPSDDCTCTRTSKVIVQLYQIPTTTPAITRSPDETTTRSWDIYHRNEAVQVASRRDGRPSFEKFAFGQTPVFASGSWRKMYFSQPPCPVEFVNVSPVKTSYRPAVCCGKPIGLTFGMDRLLNCDVATVVEYAKRIRLLQGAVPQLRFDDRGEDLRGVGAVEELMKGMDVVQEVQEGEAEEAKSGRVKEVTDDDGDKQKEQ